MPNPLLEENTLPPFNSIEPQQVEPAIKSLIECSKTRINALLEEQDTYSWDNLLAPIEALEDALSQAWSPVSHLNSVCNNEAMREAYNTCLPLLSEYQTWKGQHEKLCAAYREMASSPHFSSMDSGVRRAVEKALRDFRLAGVDLSPEEKVRYGELKKDLSRLGSRFSENVLDATNAWSRLADRKELAGLPQNALANARQAAEQSGDDGYLITLEFPSLSPVLNYCDNRALREEVYTAHCTRASQQGPNAGKWDNSELITQTLDLRHQLAQLLGFDHYADLSLATKMADSADSVRRFLNELAEKSLPQARREWAELEAFAKQEGGLERLEAWDTNYYSEKLREARYQVSQEDIRPYLPVDRVIPGLFEVVRRLYGLEVREVEEFDRYHCDARLFEILAEGEVIACFYLDLYARAHKRGGAWMDECRVRRETSEGLQLPVAYLVCNFTPPVGNEPALLTHNELTTLFHEFGHGLHHMLTRQTVAAISGINGVEWDAVELPSQFLENWCWEPEALSFISGHHQTGEPLPEELLKKLGAARNFQSGMAMVRQLEFALFDFRLHADWGSNAITSVQGVLDDVRKQVAVVKAPPFNRFQNGFSHIFAGGYAAGYYSYKWAEVLSSDAFSRFEEEGIFNTQTGQAFRHHILEAGGSKDAMELFVAFRGREPSIDPLLRHSGITG
ncbi:MAG: oligopeptidase A [Halieaceae bacterium]|nr:oligopeptidase A [Halieaceae bacterium]